MNSNTNPLADGALSLSGHRIGTVRSIEEIAKLTPLERLQLDYEALAERVAKVERDQKNFLKAMTGASKMLLDNPVASAMIPKDMKRTLREYVAAEEASNPDGQTS